MSVTGKASEGTYAAGGTLEELAGGERLGRVAQGGGAGDEGESSESSLGEVATEHFGWGQGRERRKGDEGEMSACCLL